jgi:hypothetical protein
MVIHHDAFLKGAPGYTTARRDKRGRSQAVPFSWTGRVAFGAFGFPGLISDRGDAGHTT